MSRTYRFRKSKYIPWWNNYEWREWVECSEEEYLASRYNTRIGWFSYISGLKYERKLEGRELKKELAKQRRDATFRCKEPGPSSYRNLTSERPHRRNAKEQLRKYLLEDYEVIIPSKPSLDYYT